MILAALALLACTATDGDTIRCGDERIRLLGIDAPELPGHCRKGRNCASGDPHKAKARMAALIRGGVTVERIKKDRYGRTIAVVRSGGVNLSCALLASGDAVYVARWDDGGRVARECR